MYTRCQGCHTVHPVNAALLARGKGRYRCGKCSKVNNALESLFDTWPDAGQNAAAAGDLPELGAPLQLDYPDEDPESIDDVGEEDKGRASRLLMRSVWITAAIVIAVIAGLNLARYFEIPLLDHPALIPVLERTGVREPPAPAEFRAIGQIEIISREMIAHPDRPGVLLLNATLVNRADRPQPYPDIAISLLNLDNRVLTERQFTPADYLMTDAAQAGDLMAPEAYVGLSLEIPDPGETAVGFEIEFE